MTIGPEPKPIRTGATIHTVCITTGPLSTYKLFARVYGGKYDQDVDKWHKHISCEAKARGKTTRGDNSIILF